MAWYSQGKELVFSLINIFIPALSAFPPLVSSSQQCVSSAACSYLEWACGWRWGKGGCFTFRGLQGVKQPCPLLFLLAGPAALLILSSFRLASCSTCITQHPHSSIHFYHGWFLSHCHVAWRVWHVWKLKINYFWTVLFVCLPNVKSWAMW